MHSTMEGMNGKDQNYESISWLYCVPLSISYFNVQMDCSKPEILAFFLPFHEPRSTQGRLTQSSM